MAVDLELLKTACYFPELDNSNLEAIRRFVFERKVPAGEVFLWEGDEDEVLYFVISGQLKLFSTSTEGREFIIRIVYGGDSINDDTIFNKGPNILSAMTMSPAVLYGLYQQDLNQILHAHPQVNLNITETFATR